MQEEVALASGVSVQVEVGSIAGVTEGHVGGCNLTMTQCEEDAAAGRGGSHRECV